MKSLLTALAMLSLLFAQPTLAQSTTPPRQDLGALQQAAQDFMQVQATGLPGTVTIAVDPVDPRLILPACAAPQAFMPNGGRLWGKTSIGIKCTAPSPWVIYVRATVQVIAEYIVTSAPLAQGQTIGPNDISKVRGDLSALPNGIITEESQAIGRTVATSLALGTPLRQDTLRSQRVVQQGQAVRVVSIGPGFQISTEARAMSNATEGQLAQARTPAGQVVSGIAKAGGILEINY
ncbi:flagellar basal body P-ring formation chaperone FlgA [Herbaspirillum autotrophicum]|uniref:flagellar basal body P-ring formation chaperone FlgA n=1 Tax=Herbaspirillum autotrophicum TaxID=180195 RepID=UPI00067E4A99|nr:flagellar basal body P-ring formation chaperone FlgA [Herbaspirillum autotrophicum]